MTAKSCPLAPAVAVPASVRIVIGATRTVIQISFVAAGALPKMAAEDEMDGIASQSKVR